MRFALKLRDWMLRHLMVSVVSILGTAWITISFAVFLAERHAPDSSIFTYGDALWWGIVTFLTVGYGDLVPVTAIGKFFASFLMLTGVGSVGIMTAKISSFFLEQALREGRGMVDSNKLKDHFVVCGWKEEMHQLLTHILDFNPGLKSHQLVLVANISGQVIDNIRSHPRLKALQVIPGEYYHDANLRRASPASARKILILADRTPGLNGQVPSMTEVDARTVMTAMTLANIARGTLVTAEILDPKMDHYLKLASVSEIIYSREYSRLLLGNASGGTGIANVIFDLLDPKHPTVIATKPIPTAFYGSNYADFKAQFESQTNSTVLLGILENTGNSQHIKELALRQAQKTPDMKRFVENLKSVKDLRCNHPVFSPPGDYVVHEGCMAIVIEQREANEYKQEDAPIAA